MGAKDRPTAKASRVAGRLAEVRARWEERIIEKLLLLTALSSIFGLALITGFILKEGLPFIIETGAARFVFSSEWSPNRDPAGFGILPMIAGSLSITLGALALGVPLGLGCAVFLTEYAPRRVATVMKPALELLAGIPSVVYGFLGMVILVPLIRERLGGSGYSILAGSIVLSVMILPTIISISMDAIAAVPRSYREGSVALGATNWQTTHMLVLRAARSGILAAIILGMGRAVGETMAVIMVAGNSPAMPNSLLDPVRTLTSTIGIEMAYAAGEHQRALFGVGVVLFCMIMILNSIALRVSQRKTGEGAA